VASSDVPVGSVTLMPSGSHSLVASIDVSNLPSKSTPYSIYAEYIPDDLAGIAGLAKVQSAPQTLTVGTIVTTPHPTSVTLSRAHSGRVDCAHHVDGHCRGAAAWNLDAARERAVPRSDQRRADAASR